MAAHPNRFPGQASRFELLAIAKRLVDLAWCKTEIRGIDALTASQPQPAGLFVGLFKNPTRIFGGDDPAIGLRVNGSSAATVIEMPVCYQQGFHIVHAEVQAEICQQSVGVGARAGVYQYDAAGTANRVNVAVQGTGDSILEASHEGKR